MENRLPGPRYLFHWTTAAALRGMARGAAALKAFPIVKPIPAASVMHRGYPQLRKRAVLYAWSHPVTAMASNPALIYAGSKTADARILILELRESPTVLFLSTPVDLAGTRRIDKASLAAADLIYNEIRYVNGTLVREWLILNAAVIKNFTASPAALRAYFTDEAVRLSDPDYEYAEAAFHNRSAPLVRRGSDFFISITSLPQLRKTIVIPRLKAVSRLKDARIPKPLRRPFSLDPSFLASCSAA